MRTQIVYEDDAILVVYKPSGLATQSAQVSQADVVSELTNYLAQKNGGRQSYLGLIHRLDQTVEGLLVFAKDKKAASLLSAQLGGDHTGSFPKECGKIYYAVVYPEKASDDPGEMIETKAPVVLTDYLIKDNRTRLARIVSEKEPQAKKAVLSYEILSRKEDLAFVKVRLQTGRFHQIRVQLAGAKMPILGDLKYGSEQSKKRAGQLHVRSVALCAGELFFTHPKTGKKVLYTVKPQNNIFRMFEAGVDE